MSVLILFKWKVFTLHCMWYYEKGRKLGLWWQNCPDRFSDEIKMFLATSFTAQLPCQCLLSNWIQWGQKLQYSIKPLKIKDVCTERCGRELNEKTTTVAFFNLIFGCIIKHWVPGYCVWCLLFPWKESSKNHVTSSSVHVWDLPSGRDDCVCEFDIGNRRWRRFCSAVLGWKFWLSQIVGPWWGERG